MCYWRLAAHFRCAASTSGSEVFELAKQEVRLYAEVDRVPGCRLVSRSTGPCWQCRQPIFEFRTVLAEAAEFVVCATLVSK